MLTTRIKTAIVLISILVFAVLGGTWSLSLLATAAVFLSLYELYLMSTGLGKLECAKLSAAIALPIVGYIYNSYQGLFSGLLLSCLLQVAFIVWIVEKTTHLTDFSQIASSLGLGLLYPGIFGLSLIPLVLNYPMQYPILLIVSVATADTAAYFGGKAIGGAKLAPRLSPKKTVSGAIVGILGATISTYLFHIYFIWEPISQNPLIDQIEVLLIGFILGIFSIFGDLMASLCKRAFRVKDSGDLLPGHGGVLDRIDGVLAAAPVLLLYLS